MLSIVTYVRNPLSVTANDVVKQFGCFHKVLIGGVGGGKA